MDHHCGTSNRHKIPMPLSETLRNSYSYLAPKLWIKLPFEVDSSKSVFTFLKQLKCLLRNLQDVENLCTDA